MHIHSALLSLQRFQKMTRSVQFPLSLIIFPLYNFY